MKLAHLPLWIALLITLSGAGCTLGGPSGGYAFIDATIQPLSDPSGVILVSSSNESGTLASRNYELFIELENKMAQPARNVRVEVTNVNPSIIDFSPLTTQGTIDEIAPFEGPEPWFDSITATILVTEPRNSYATQARYHVCAEATTIFEDTVCIAPNDPTRSYEYNCDPISKEVSEGQQAPVAVTAIRQADALEEVSVFIDVVNFGDGLVFDYTNSCSRISQDSTGRIELTRVRISGEDVTEHCNTRARMGFSQKYQKYTGTTFTCSIPKTLIIPSDLESTVETDISVELTYDYHVLAEQQSIIVRKV